MSFIQRCRRLKIRLHLSLSSPILRHAVRTWTHYLSHLSQCDQCPEVERWFFEDHVDYLARILLPTEWSIFIDTCIPQSCHEHFRTLLVARTQGASEHSPFRGVAEFYTSTLNRALQEVWRSAQTLQCVDPQKHVRRIKYKRLIRNPILIPT